MHKDIPDTVQWSRVSILPEDVCFAELFLLQQSLAEARAQCCCWLITLKTLYKHQSGTLIYSNFICCGCSDDPSLSEIQKGNGWSYSICMFRCHSNPRYLQVLALMHKITNWKQHKKMDCLCYRFNLLPGSCFVTGTYKPAANITL